VSKTIKIVAGLDVGDVSSFAYVEDSETKAVLWNRSVPTTKEDLQWVFRRWQGLRIALEVGTHSPWVAEVLEEMGHEVLVANARKLRCIFGSTNKQDCVDAKTLAWLAQAQPRLLYPIRHRRRETREDLAVLRARCLLVRMRAEAVNAVRGMVKSHGSRLRTCATERFHLVAMESMPAGLRPALEPVVATVKNLTERIEAYDRDIETMAREKYPETQALVAVPRVGYLTALCYVLTLEDPSRFRKSRDVGPFLGLVPRRDQSGDTDRQLSITKTGDTYLRSLLVEAAQGMLQRRAEDTNLRRWGLSHAGRGGAAGKKRALVGLARRLSVLLHHLWVTQAKYEPLYRPGNAKAENAEPGNAA
jgi:transposase